MMFLELTLYFLIGLTFLRLSKFRFKHEWMKAVLVVILWPFYILLKYVECVDSAKNEAQREDESA